MLYYESIASMSKSELLKEADKNIKELEKKKIPYKKELKEFVLWKFQLKKWKLEELNGENLYLINIQLNVIFNKRKEE